MKNFLSCGKPSYVGWGEKVEVDYNSTTEGLFHHYLI